MYKYVLKRLLMMIPVLIGVSFLVFFILAVSPGDPTRMILGQQASEAAVQAMREELGLNHNLFVRYFDYMADALQGDFGTSWKSQLEVLPQVLGYFPNVYCRYFGSDTNRCANWNLICEKAIYLD